MAGKIFGHRGSKFWNIVPTQLRTLVIDTFRRQQYWYKCPTSWCSSNGQMLWPSRIWDENLHVICYAFCLISSDTMMWNISGGEPSTWIKSIKNHKKSTLSLGQQIWRKTLFTSIQSVRPRSEIWMAWVHWHKGRGYNRNHHQVLDLQSLYLHMIWMIMLRGNMCPWDIILYIDATHMGKCCDPQEHLINVTGEFKHGTKGYISTERNVLMGLKFRWCTFSGSCLILAERESMICTSMYSSGFLPISSDTICSMGNQLPV